MVREELGQEDRAGWGRRDPSLGGPWMGFTGRRRRGRPRGHVAAADWAGAAVEEILSGARRRKRLGFGPGISEGEVFI